MKKTPITLSVALIVHELKRLAEKTGEELVVTLLIKQLFGVLL